MKETLIKMRRELEPLLGQRETQAVVRLIFRNLKGWDAAAMIAHEGDTLSSYMRSSIDRIIARIKDGEPVQYVLGEAYFHGMDLEVTPAVLIPRPETSQLVDIIVDSFGNSRDLCVLDIGTGSGAIAIALSRSLKFADVTALDVSREALAVARRNAEKQKADVCFIESDIFEWEGEKESFDIVVSNPPYIMLREKSGMDRSVKDFEPAIALFVSDDDPLLIYRRISDVAFSVLKPGGLLYLEINPLCARELKEMLSENGFINVEIERDMYGKERFAICRR